jgi:hypothetical protein
MQRNGNGQNILTQACGLFAGNFCVKSSAGIMFGFKRNKEAERFYLLPGQGGQAWRRKQKFILKWAIVVGLLVAAVLGALLYFFNKPEH